MTQLAQHVVEPRPNREPAVDPKTDKKPHPIQKALDLIAADAFDAPETYLKDTRVPEGGE